MRTKYKPWAKPFLEEHLEVQFNKDELASAKDFCLEIGSGKGDFLLKMAEKNPDRLFIGIEKNVTCAGFIAKKLVEHPEISNAKLIYDDAINVVINLPENSLDYLFLNFSDPWPKKRHHKRRLTSDVFLKEYQRVIIKGGRLIFKTDNLDLFNDSLEYFQNSDFTLVSVTNDYQGDDTFDTQTEYETKKRKEGIPINRVIFQK